MTFDPPHYDELVDTVSRHLAELLGIERSAIEPSSVLLELGAESIDFVQLVLRLEREYNVELPRTYAVPDAYTVDTFAQALADTLRCQTGRNLSRV